ncbi:hypothetical protein QR680_003191 [Steinernema hermaphroditum]|uniref:Amiloride-sensitive sodium channel n=1 Tax=Steinernema hermaphroditum TaxID=289476 RepID=A0AA39H5S9_9BILA|nr:hypothetical protein QR680_003191 [Steinernema hermaphroditum]
MPTVEGKEVSWKEIFLGKQWRKYAFWFIVLFLTILTIKDVVDLFVQYADNPKKADMNIVFNESMTMPNITFCMSRKQAWSHFKINASEPSDEWDMTVQDHLMNMTDHNSFLNQPWDFRLVMEAYETIATLSSMERETTAHGSVRSINIFRTQPRLAQKRKMIKMWLDVIEDRGVTFEEFTQKTGFETLRRSMQRFQRTSYDEDLVIKTKLHISWISMMQMCYQPMFDEDNFKNIEDQGNFFTMMLSHNSENLDGQDVECMSVDVHGRPSSLSRFIEGKGRARDGFNEELCLGIRHEVSVEVRAVYKMLENDDDGTACRDVEEGEDNEFDCRSRCRMNMIRDICHCTPPTLSYLVDEDVLKKFPLCNYTNCQIDVQGGNYSDAECGKNCFRDCHQIRYDIDHDQKGRMVRKDLTLVNLNWGSFEYLTLEQDWVWTIATFIAALGGSIGMWLGLSILSLIQFASYVYEYITGKVKEKLKKDDVHPRERKASIVSQMGDRKLSENPFAGSEISANPFSNPFGSEEGANDIPMKEKEMTRINLD